MKDHKSPQLPEVVGLSRRTSLVGRFPLAALAVCVLGHGVYAADGIWTASGNGSWAVSTNWSNGVPGAANTTNNTDTVTFAGGISPTITIDSGRNIKNITFDTYSLNYTLSGGSLLLTDGGVIQIASTATNTNRVETINSAITLEGDYTFLNASSNSASVMSFGAAATITSAATSGTTTLTLDGGNIGTNAVNGVISNGGGTNVVALTKNGAGLWQLGGNNTHKGATTINAGTVQLNGLANNIGAVYIAAGATLQENPSNGVSSTYTTTIGPLSGAGTLKYANATVVGTFTINQTSDSTFSGVITPGNVANGGFDVFVKNGTGVLTLNGAAGSLSLQRGFTVNAGGLTLAGNATLSLPKTASGRDIFTVNQGASITLDNSATNVANRLGVLDDSITLNGGSFNLIGSSAATTSETITAHNASSNVTYGLVFGAGTDVVNVVAGAGQSSTLTISAGGIGRAAGATALVRGSNLGAAAGADVANVKSTATTVPKNSATGAAGSGATTGILTGVIADSVISGVDTFGIATYDTTNGVRRLVDGTENVGSLTSNANVKAVTSLTNTTITVNSLQLDSGGSIDNTAGTLTVAGATILSTGAASSIGSGGGSTLKSGATGTTELIIYNAPSSNLTIGSTILTSGGLTKGGDGISTITADNSASLSGTVTINGGTLSISSANNLGAAANAVAINNGGILQSTGASVALNHAIVLGGTTAGTVTSGTIDVSGSATNSLDTGTGVISGVGSLTKTGVGKLTLSANNTYTGATNVLGGEMDVDGSLASASAVSVAPGAILGGRGTINGTTTVRNGTINGNGLTLAGSTAFSGGTSTLAGTTTTSGNVSVASSATLAVSGTTTGNVAVSLGGTFQGAGRVVGTISGAGLVSPGNSPGILTANSVSVGSGMSFAFELGSNSVAYDNATESGNDILHLTGASAFSGNLTAGNTISVYFSSSTPSGDYLGGFFVDSLTAGLLYDAVKSATINYYVKDTDGNYDGDAYFNGSYYAAMDPSLVTLSTAGITNAAFATGITSGSELEFTVVPEPSTWAMLTGGFAVLAVGQRIRRRLA